MDTVKNIIELALQGISSIPLLWFYIFGVSLAGGIGLSATVAFITYRRKWKALEKLAKHIVGLMQVGIGFAIALSAYVLDHTGTIANILHLSYFSHIAPYLVVVWPAVLTVSTKFYELGGSKLYPKIADTISVWATGRKRPETTIFPTNPTKAAKALVSTDEEDDEVLDFIH